MSVKSRWRRMVMTLGLLTCIIVIAACATHTPKRDVRADARMQAKVFAGLYQPGSADRKLNGAIGKAVTAAAKAEAASKGEEWPHCGEYDCEYDWGTGIYECFGEGEWANFVGSIWLQCKCGSDGDCRWDQNMEQDQ